jgi:hypothetical protein
MKISWLRSYLCEGRSRIFGQFVTVAFHLSDLTP